MLWASSAWCRFLSTPDLRLYPTSSKPSAGRQLVHSMAIWSLYEGTRVVGDPVRIHVYN